MTPSHPDEERCAGGEGPVNRPDNSEARSSSGEFLRLSIDQASGNLPGGTAPRAAAVSPSPTLRSGGLSLFYLYLLLQYSQGEESAGEVDQAAVGLLSGIARHAAAVSPSPTLRSGGGGGISLLRKNEINLSGLIAPSFHGVHRDIKKHKYTHYSLYGGRGSAKSSFVSVEALLLIKRNPELHAAVFRKVASTLRDSVYAQYIWAVAALGLENEFACSVSPMQIVYKPTGQRILFRGSDDWSKIKSLKVPFGYIGVTHFEELDQFDSRAEIRSILQSTMRGGEHFWNFETFNPPRSQSNWVNKDILETRNDRLAHKSDYLGVPQEWLGRQFLEEAELLKKTNETAYRHEYLGEVTGTGGSVFRNVAAREISAQEISAFDRIYMGVDWGYYPDPFAWNKMHYDANRRVLYIFDELTLFRASNRDSERALREKDVKDYELITADSSEPKSVADYKSFGLSCRAAVKGAGSVEYSMKWLAGLDAVIIDPVRCRDTLKEFLEYEFDRGRNDEVINAYPDRENHHIDAVRYAMERVWKRRGL